ncbi:MAG: hypothetical protein MUE60_05770 [Candidatus Eisenbacteria bacterium]|jgi:spermidine synthase|nr:hypothetical protein [Candidatus Eisenbacteria bacterium]
MTFRPLAPPKTHLAAFLAAFSVISSELLLLRILSGIRIGFTLASFFVYASTILGLGLGNFIWISHHRKPPSRIFACVPFLPALLFLLILFVLVFSLVFLQFVSRSAFFDYIMICMYLLYPFFVAVYVLFGYVLAHILTCAADSGGLLRTWACDIAGSALGGALPIVLVSIADPLVLYFLPVLGSLLLVIIIMEIPRRSYGIRVGLPLAVAASGAVYAALIPSVREFDLLQSARDREYGSVPDRIVDTARGFLFGDYRTEYIGWSPYRKLNFTKADGLYVVLYDNLGTTALITQEASPAERLRMAPSPLYSYPRDLSRVIIIGAGAAPQVGYFSGRADSIVAVELDPAVVAFTLSHADEAPYLLSPGVNYLSWEGLSYLKSHPGPYSLIIYPVADSFIASSLQSLVKAENYLYTVEGLRTAVESLGAKGVLFIHLAESMNEYGRQAMINTYPTVAVHLFRNMLELGINPDCTAVLTTRHEAGRGIFMIYEPGGIDRSRLLNLVSDDSSLAVLTDSASFLRTAAMAKTTTNNRPFFYIAGRTPPAPVREAAAFLLATSLAAVSFVVRRARRGGVFSGLDRFFARKQVAYAAFTGFGFMTIVTVLIQRIVPVFGAPYLAGTVVITAVLIGAGVTSFLMGLRRTPVPAAMVRGLLGLTVAAILCLPALTESMTGSLASLTLAGRIALCGGVFLPLGLLIGVPFPFLLERAQAKGSAHVVLAYATDISFSILGIVVSLVLPIVTGYAVMFYAAAAAYGGILLILFSFRDSSTTAPQPESSGESSGREKPGSRRHGSAKLMLPERDEMAAELPS